MKSKVCKKTFYFYNFLQDVGLSLATSEHMFYPLYDQKKQLLNTFNLSRIIKLRFKAVEK